MSKGIARELAALTEKLTATEIVELTDAEIAEIFGAGAHNCNALSICE